MDRRSHDPYSPVANAQVGETDETPTEEPAAPQEPVTDSSEPSLTVEDVPEGAAEVVEWIGADAERAQLAKQVEDERPESKRRVSVYDAIESVLGGS